MWECPDLFCLDGKDVLIMSPQDMYPSGLEYASGNGTMAVIGKIDPEDQTFHEQNNHSIDYGIDFLCSSDPPDSRWTKNHDGLDAKLGYGWASEEYDGLVLADDCSSGIIDSKWQADPESGA